MTSFRSLAEIKRIFSLHIMSFHLNRSHASFFQKCEFEFWPLYTRPWTWTIKLSSSSNLWSIFLIGRFKHEFKMIDGWLILRQIFDLDSTVLSTVIKHKSSLSNTQYHKIVYQFELLVIGEPYSLNTFWLRVLRLSR